MEKTWVCIRKGGRYIPCYVSIEKTGKRKGEFGTRFQALEFATILNNYKKGYAEKK
jgi:hypothetical protein